MKAIATLEEIPAEIGDTLKLQEYQQKAAEIDRELMGLAGSQA